jgi:hypothetical protein
MDFRLALCGRVVARTRYAVKPASEAILFAVNRVRLSYFAPANKSPGIFARAKVSKGADERPLMAS